MPQFTSEFLRDRIYACWMGKNIGGTLGTPYEGCRDMQDIHGFASQAGEPLPNDDLDLQLVWLRAVNDLGPDAINSKVLGEYWLSWITPNWNEYGVCKANMRAGILPPMSGEYNNELWKNSNGAWIRTEIWACLYPAVPEKAIRLAFEDASVDHGFGEGTYAAIFVAAMESAAFAVQDRKTLLNIGLSKIPADCRVARSVKLVMDCYAQGVDWKECRARIVKDSEDLGWFQAPGNVAFVALGLLYGEGDFKQSLIYAIDCGDDTDCTGATLGSLMGIMGGMDCLPRDWMAYIGEGIKSICLTNGHGKFPESIGELTDCIMNLLPVTLRQDHAAVLSTRAPKPLLGDALELSDVNPEAFYGRDFVDALASRKPYSYTIEGLYATALVEFDEKPRIRPNEALSGRITLRCGGNPNDRNFLPEQKHFLLRFLVPEGWQMDAARSLYAPTPYYTREMQHCATAFTLHAGDRVDAVNRVILEVTVPGRPEPLLVPMQIMG